jgi:RNA polymerase sigma factor (sigma-70 family)
LVGSLAFVTGFRCDRAVRPAPELLDRCRAGDEAAWGELVDRYSRYVHAIVVRGFQLSPADAEDVFQEVFFRTYQHLDRVYDDEALRPWLGQLTRRLCLDVLRRQGRVHPDADAGDDVAAFDPALERIEQALDVRAALGLLSEHCQEMLDRFFARDQSYATIGAELDLPPGTIASRISRCLGRLRAALGEDFRRPRVQELR